MKFPFSKKKTAAYLALGIVFASVATDGGLLYNKVGPNQAGLKTTFGKILSKDMLKSGVHFNVPLVQYTHDYNMQVQNIRFTSGGVYFLPFGESTGDRNTLLSDVTLNYRVIPDAVKLGYHRWSMDGFLLSDGFWLLTKMLNDSTNAVMGKQSMADTISSPKEFADELLADLAIRLETNNIPIKIESIELNSFKTFMPTKSISYQNTAMPSGPRGQD